MRNLCIAGAKTAGISSILQKQEAWNATVHFVESAQLFDLLISLNPNPRRYPSRFPDDPMVANDPLNMFQRD
jgi:hypothetical protein